MENDTASMTEPTLSLAANAVLDAYMNNCGWLDGPLEKDSRCAAAVLRAAADQVVPSQPVVDPTWVGDAYKQRQDTRAYLLAIATELESQ